MERAARPQADAPDPAPSAPPEERHPPLGRFVAVPGDAAGAGPAQRVHVLEAGPDDAPPLVLIHGASGNVRDFAFDFMDRLSDRFRVVAIDRPGFGHSDRGGPDMHRPDAQARVLRRAATAMGVATHTRPALVLGHSLGAASALAWALDAPDTVAGVVSLAGVSHPWPGTAGRLYELLDAPVIGALAAAAAPAMISEAYATREIGRIFRPNDAPEGYGAFVGVGLALRPATLRANGRDIARLKPLMAAQAARYGTLRAPVAVIHGEADRIVPKSIHAEPLAAAAPAADPVWLPDVGHMPHHAAPETVVAAIDRLAARSGLG